MVEVGIREAKATLSRLLMRVAAGETVTITNRGKIVARLVAAEAGTTRTLGEDAGRYAVGQDFDAQLPDDLRRAFST